MLVYIHQAKSNETLQRWNISPLSKVETITTITHLIMAYMMILLNEVRSCVFADSAHLEPAGAAPPHIEIMTSSTKYGSG